MKKLFSVMVYALFLLLAVEIGLRIIMHYTHGMPIFDTRRYVSDPYVLWRNNPHYRGIFYSFKRAYINRHGFLGDELEEPKGEDLIRIVVLGGSVVMGHGVSRVDQTMAAILEECLNSIDLPYRYEVVNAATMGYTSYIGRQFVEHYLADVEPDILYIAFGWNDSILDYGSDKDPTDRHKRRTDLCPKWYKEYSMLGAIVPKALAGVGRRLKLYHPVFNPEGKPLVPRVCVDDYCDNMRAICCWCQDDDVRVILGTEPLPQSGREIYKPIERVESYHDAIRKVAANMNLPIADMDAAFEELGADQFFDDLRKDYIHPNARGQEVMAEVLFATLQEAGYLDSRVRQNE